MNSVESSDPSGQAGAPVPSPHAHAHDHHHPNGAVEVNTAAAYGAAERENFEETSEIGTHSLNTAQAGTFTTIAVLFAEPPPRDVFSIFSSSC